MHLPRNLQRQLYDDFVMIFIATATFGPSWQISERYVECIFNTGRINFEQLMVAAWTLLSDCKKTLSDINKQSAFSFHV